MCLVSIIIPVFNAEKWLERCIGSCLAQTYKELEVIAVNDGSTDGSLDILENFSCQDSRLHIVNIKNSGVTTARFTGVWEANGEYVFFVDADDFLPLSAVECLVAEIGGDQPDMVLGEYVSYQEGTVLSRIINTQGHIVKTQLDFLRTVLVEGIIPVVSKLIRTELIKKVNLPASFKWGEDFAMMVQLAAFSSKVFLTHHHVYYYVHNIESVTKSAGLDVFLTWRDAMVYSENFLINEGILSCIEKEWRLRELMWELTAYRTALRWGYRVSNLRTCAWNSLVLRPRIGFFILRNVKWKWRLAFMGSLLSPYCAALALSEYGKRASKRVSACSSVSSD